MSKIAQKENYEEICKELGFNPKIGFVEITDTGAISFSCGKKEEITALYAAVKAKDYKVSDELLRAVRAIWY